LSVLFVVVICYLSVAVVYLYGAAATSDYRKTVPQIRVGEYEGLREKVYTGWAKKWHSFLYTS